MTEAGAIDRSHGAATRGSLAGQLADLDRDDADFPVLGAAFAETGAEASGPIGSGIARVMRQRDVVDFAVDWIPRHRQSS